MWIRRVTDIDRHEYMHLLITSRGQDTFVQEEEIDVLSRDSDDARFCGVNVENVPLAVRVVIVRYGD
jgi:hypothetical protein